MDDIRAFPTNVLGRASMKEQTAAICVIVKDEASDIAEWLIHHRMIGFDQLIVYDNELVDGTSELVPGVSGYAAA